MTQIDNLLRDVKTVFWTDPDGNREKHYKVHTQLNPDLWERIEEIFGEDWVQMRDVVIGNDYQLGGRFATVPEELWKDMVTAMRQRLFVIHMEVREWDGKIRPYHWKEWCETKEEAIDKAGPDRPEVISFEIFEARNNQRNRYTDAYTLYKELHSPVTQK